VGEDAVHKKHKMRELTIETQLPISACVPSHANSSQTVIIESMQGLPPRNSGTKVAKVRMSALCTVKSKVPVGTSTKSLKNVAQKHQKFG
jgi:hypothetical protein